MNETKKFTMEVKTTEDGEYYIEFSEEMLNLLQWKENDVLQWDELSDNSWKLFKVNKEDLEQK